MWRSVRRVFAEPLRGSTAGNEGRIRSGAGSARGLRSEGSCLEARRGHLGRNPQPQCDKRSIGEPAEGPAMDRSKDPYFNSPRSEIETWVASGGSFVIQTR